MKKVRELRDTVERLAAMHSRLGSHECGQALHELSETMRAFDEQTVAAFVKRANPKRTNAKSTRRR
jgi:hypothetical protein